MLMSNKVVHIGKVECPIHIIHGDQDRVIPIGHSEALKNDNEKIDLTILERY